MLSASLATALFVVTAPDPLFVADSPAGIRQTGKLLALTPAGAELDTVAGKVAVAGVLSLRRTNVPLPPLNTPV